MEETDRLFACKFCRVKSYLKAPDVFRYMLPSAAPASKDLLYFPYWRFKGMQFSCANNGVDHKFVDVSYQAISSPVFPVSLGLRSQALKLKFITPETEGRFLKPTQSLTRIGQIFDKRFDKTLPKPVLHHAHIGETISLIYAPYYIENRLYDGVLNSPISAPALDASELNQLPDENPHWRIHFMATLCPNCGWDLDGERDSLVLLCQNCKSAWYPVGKSLKQIKFCTHPSDDKNALYLPFWRIKCRISGLELQSYADLIKVANIPRVVQPGWEKIGFRFWVPAFKVRPKIFMQLSKNMTLAQLHTKHVEELPEARHYRINLPVTEANESLKVNLASFLKPKNQLIDVLPLVSITARSFAAVYVPFIEKHHEYIQPDLHFAINKNTLKLSEHF
ncbi:MAG: hypothetical protein PVG35_07335 [Desulfobacterales bacterium]|jgi:hypothetical protein